MNFSFYFDMSIESVDFSLLPLREMFELTATNFSVAAFRVECEKFAQFDAQNSDEDLLQMQISDGIFMQVPLSCGMHSKGSELPLKLSTVNAGITSVLWWDSYAETNSPSYSFEHNLFNGKYNELLVKAKSALGDPSFEGQNQDAMAHKFAFWRGKNGLFVVQQSAFDLQFGYDINLWVQPWTGPNPEPGKLFIDVLTERLRDL